MLKFRLYHRLITTVLITRKDQYLFSNFHLIMLQTLEIAKEPRHLSRQQHQVYREPDFLAIPVYPDCCLAWYADIWWKVSVCPHEAI